jgi:hypothetical protein
VVDDATLRGTDGNCDLTPEVTTADDPDAAIEQRFQAWQAETDARYMALRHKARASYSAMEGWQRVESEDA